jgi:hypothetical protein
MPTVQLRPFVKEDLPTVEPWFDDVDTQMWLGGRRWPGLILDLASRPLGKYRGAVETGRYAWLAWDRDTPVGFVDCGTTDRWTTWEGACRATVSKRRYRHPLPTSLTWWIQRPDVAGIEVRSSWNF